MSRGHVGTHNVRDGKYRNPKPCEGGTCGHPSRGTRRFRCACGALNELQGGLDGHDRVPIRCLGCDRRHWRVRSWW